MTAYTSVSLLGCCSPEEKAILIVRATCILQSNLKICLV